MVNYIEMSKYKYPLHILLHPADGYQELKYNKKGSLKISFAILFLWYLSSISVRQIQDFAFNPTRPGKLNILMVAASTLLIFAVAVIANWCFSTLMDGKGTLRDIWIVCSYTLIPIIIAMWTRIILSYFMVIDEGVFLTYIDQIAKIWTGVLMFIGLSTVHEFSFIKTVNIIALTFLGMLIILFLFILIYTLYQQIMMFGTNVFYEILYRFYKK